MRTENSCSVNAFPSVLEMGEMLMRLRVQSKAGGSQSSQEELDIVKEAEGIIATKRWWLGVFPQNREECIPKG